MRNFICIFFSFLFLISCSNNVITNQNNQCNKIGVMIANPWTDCNNNLVLASKVAGFTFPLICSNCNVRAMKGMIEINYPLNENRTVCIRKVMEDKGYDISGVYTKYQTDKQICLDNGVSIRIRATEDKIYVMYMSGSNGYYSAYCKEGMNLKEVESISNIIAQAESPKK